MYAIVFGVNGQDGYYLSILLKRYGIYMVGVSRSNHQYSIGDVSDQKFVEQLIKSYQPEYVFHLAANSTTRHDSLFENYASITTGTLNILEAVYLHSKHTRVFISGSGLQFVNNGKPIAETDTFEARDSYSMARIQSVYTARYYRSLGIQTYVGYFFNHDSPLRSERHVNQKIVLTARDIANGKTDELTLGDISVQKEFTFAGDVVEAIWLLVNNDKVFETTIGSGKAYPISYWVELCFNYFNLDWKQHVSLRSDFFSEYNVLVSDPSTILSIGWQPQITIEALAEMMITHQESMHGT